MKLRCCLQYLVILILSGFFLEMHVRSRTTLWRIHLQDVQRCSIDNLHRDLQFLDHVRAIEAAEFVERRDTLARALFATKVDAFVLEPGYTFQYYANISQRDWEPWEPEERPFLMIVRPSISNISGDIVAKTSWLAPAFEEGRVRMLGIPSVGELDIITWEEEWNPYRTLRDNLFANSENITVMVDEEMRDYIVRGLNANDFMTVGLGGDVEAVRQIKTPAEIEILRAINTGTVEAIRAMRLCLVPGLTENQVVQILDNTLLSVGFQLFFDIVLFESNAALPHGGFATGDKILNYETMVLIDVGAHYLGYSSDVCRSFFIPAPKIAPWQSLSKMVCKLLLGCNGDYFPMRDLLDISLHTEKIKVWQIVFQAQTEASKMFKPNNTAASVDIAARTVIEDAGYTGAFTHRVGHGIGIKAHESPYLNKGNHKTLLKPGMTFTNEPGIYLVGRFGIRHEDVYLVKEDGPPEILSGKRATSADEP